MKTMMFAIGALTLSTSAALAKPMYRDADMAAPAPRGAEEVYYADPAYDGPAAGVDYGYFDGREYAPNLSPQNDTWAKDHTVNMGSGTSRSSAANNG